MKLVLRIWIINLLLVYIFSFFTNTYTGDFKETIELGFLGKTIVFFLVSIFYFSSYYISKIKFKVKEIGIDRESFKKFTDIVFILCLTNILALVLTGVGKAGEVSTSKYAFLINLLGIDVFFSIFYFLSLKYRIRNIKFWIIWALYLSLKILQGWSGIIYYLFLIECYYYISTKKKNIDLITFIYIGILFLGGLLYKVVFPLKMYLRTGIKFEIAYIDAMEKLISRLTPYNNLCYIVQSFGDVSNSIREKLIDFSFLLDFLRVMLPSFIFPYKNFDNTNRLLITSKYGESFQGSVDVTIFGNLLFFLDKSILEGFTYIFMFSLLTILIIFLLKRISNSYMELQVFTLVSGFFVSGSLGVAYSKAFYNLIILNILFSLLKKNRRRKGKIENV